MLRRLTSHEAVAVVNWAILAALTVSVSLNLALSAARDDRVMIVVEVVVLALLGATIAHASYRAGQRSSRRALAQPRFRQVGPSSFRVELGEHDGDEGWDINLRLEDVHELPEPPITVDPSAWAREHRN